MIAMVREILAVPVLFDTYQFLVGANKAKRLFVDEWLRPKPGQRLLDIGCGTGAVIPFLPDDIDLVGVDISAVYIRSAKARHGHRAALFVGDAADPSLELGGDFDVAYAFGVLHHLPDALACSLIAGAIRRLRPGGRLVTIDPTLFPGQGRISHVLVSKDRGRYVRTPEDIAALFGTLRPTMEVRQDLLNIPFAQAIATLAV